MVDYVEYYWITPEQYSSFLTENDRALAFVNNCRRHEHHNLLDHKPGRDCGIPT